MSLNGWLHFRIALRGIFLLKALLIAFDPQLQAVLLAGALPREYTTPPVYSFLTFVAGLVFHLRNHRRVGLVFGFNLIVVRLLTSAHLLLNLSLLLLFLLIERGQFLGLGLGQLIPKHVSILTEHASIFHGWAQKPSIGIRGQTRNWLLGLFSLTFGRTLPSLLRSWSRWVVIVIID